MAPVINSKATIPSIGDVLEKVITSKDKRYAQLTFESGKQVVIAINPAEFNRAVSDKPVVSGNKPTQPTQKKVVTSGKVNEMVRNSPEDPNFKRKALAVLAKMDGKSPQEMLEHSQPVLSGTIGAPVVGGAAEIPTEIVNNSQDRATRLAEQLSRANGGRTGAAFAGKNTIEMK